MNTWRKDFWLPHETDFEHAERVKAAEAEAYPYLKEATALQSTLYHQTMSDLAPYRCSPKWDRLRGKALKLFREATKDAAVLFERTAECIFVTGECSEELSNAWEGLCQLEAVRNVVATAPVTRTISPLEALLVPSAKIMEGV